MAKSSGGWDDDVFQRFQVLLVELLSIIYRLRKAEKLSSNLRGYCGCAIGDKVVDKTKSDAKLILIHGGQSRNGTEK